MLAKPHWLACPLWLQYWSSHFRPRAADELIELPAAVLDSLMAGMVGGHVS